MSVTMNLWPMGLTALVGLLLLPAYLDVQKRYGLGLALMLFCIAIFTFSNGWVVNK